MPLAPAGRRARLMRCRTAPLLKRTSLAILFASLALSGDQVAAQPIASGYHTIAPCRLIDTREASSPWGGPALVAGEARAFPVTGHCQLPLSAVAVSANVTVVAPVTSGHLQLFAAGTPSPGASTVNYSAGQVRANQAIVALGSQGALTAVAHQPSGTTHLVVDVTGYFGASGCSPGQTPASVTLLMVNTGTRLLTWTGVQGATSYDVYVRPEPGQCGLQTPVLVTRLDQKVSGATSPFDLSSFNRCDTCYWADIVAVSGSCESPLRSDSGNPAPVGFSLLPCVP